MAEGDLVMQSSNPEETMRTWHHVPMHWMSEVERGSWIGPRLNGPPGCVGSTVPTGFDAYARILHPSSVSTSTPEGSSEEAWTWARVAAHTGAVIHPRVQWIRVTGHQYDSLALLDGRSADPPPLGYLEPRLLAPVMALAAEHTTAPDDVTAALWEGWGIGSGTTWSMAFVPEGEVADDHPVSAPTRGIDPRLSHALENGPFLELPGRRYVLLAISARELIDPAWPSAAGMGWSGGSAGPMPALIWPADRAWAVASEIDFDSTLIGGTYAFVDSVVDHPDIEAVRVEETTDLTWDADDVNRA